MARAAKKQSLVATVTKKAKSKKRKNSITYGNLRILNLVVAILYLIQGILILVLSDPIKGLQSITTNFLAEDQLASSASGHQVLVSASHHLLDLNIAYVVAAFLFVGALAHFIVASLKRKTYEKDLKKGINRTRWIEYSLSVGIMMISIALLSGILDFASLLMVFALTVIMSLLGMAMELRNQGASKVDWTNYSIGVAAGLVPWIVTTIYVASATLYGNGLPSFMYWIYGSLFLLLSSFVINLYLQYKKLGHWSNYLYCERTYIILSFIASTALAWQIFMGTLK